MFTGIVKGRGKIVGLERLSGLSRFKIELPSGSTPGVEIGASVAIDGVCLTVTKIEGEILSFDAMLETLRLTTLGELSVGDQVNIERAAKDGAEIGGHPLSGHVDCTATISRIDQPENNYVITFQVPEGWMKYIFSKGYVAINGTSLTITNVIREQRTFEVWLIPETLRLTTFGLKRAGDRVNLEVERGTMVMVDTVISFLEGNIRELLPLVNKNNN